MIYIVVPFEAATGGGESLHQLARVLMEENQNVSVFYSQSQISLKKKDTITECPHERFKRYRIPVAKTIEDSSDNILIVPEVETHFFHRFRHIKKVIWWLSLTFFLAQKSFHNQAKLNVFQHQWPSIMLPVAFFEALLRGRIKPSQHTYNFNSSESVFHLYNCEYARSFLVQNHVPEENMLYLCGPIDDLYFREANNVSLEDKSGRVIAYNPAKDTGYAKAVTEFLQQQGVTVELAPIENMNKEEIAALLKRTRVYMDFGYFPGPERMPREAVVMGCNIVTSKNGAANNHIDVPIPDAMKIETIPDNVRHAAKVVQTLLEEYEAYQPFYEEYKSKVTAQVQTFNRNVSLFLEKI